MHASEIASPQQFTERRNNSNDLSQTQAVKGLGKLVPEKMLQASKDEQEYFKKTNKIFTKDALKDSVYKRQIPDYLRLMEDPRNQIKAIEQDKAGMVTVISKNQGWITLTAKTMNRRKPIERDFCATDSTKTSILTPSWMQIPIDPNSAPKSDPMAAATFNGGVLRQENNRTYLVEKEQPKRSVFEAGSMRHNVAFGEIAAKNLTAAHLT